MPRTKKSGPRGSERLPKWDSYLRRSLRQVEQARASLTRRHHVGVSQVIGIEQQKEA